ncbi:MAG TPA: ion channel [Draconibacterium sp.]|nr:ion channel [Draconibacterium sp.]
MKKVTFNSSSLWNSVLLFSAIFTAFTVPVLPVHLHRIAFSVAYTSIYISAAFSLENRSKTVVTLFITTIIMQWISALLNMELLNDVSKAFNVVFFLVVVFSLIRQIALAKEVSAGVILGSLTGYLLIGIVYSLFVFFIIRIVPGAYTTQMGEIVQGGQVDASPPLYYTFITISSTGYGDILPLKPISRSLATMMAVSGQFYIAVIVALLVGKFSSQRG